MTEVDKAAKKNKSNKTDKLESRLLAVGIIGAIIWLCVAISKNIIANINISTEQNRDYYINIEDKFAFNCNAEYDEEHDTLKCTGNEISGNFSKYDTVVLTSENYAGNININNDNFVMNLPRIDITEYYRTEDFDEAKLKNTVKKKTETIKIYNSILSEYVIKKEVTLKWALTDADRQLLKEKNEAWKIKEAERKAKEAEAKAKAEEEKRQKEEAERLEKERKAQEELQKKSAECIAKGAGYWWDGAKCNYTQPAAPAPQPAPQQAPAPAPQPAAPAPQPTPQPAPQPTSQLPLKAICKDGTVSYQNDASKTDYRGMCSHHDGIQTKLGRVP